MSAAGALQCGGCGSCALCVQRRAAAAGASSGDPGGEQQGRKRAGGAEGAGVQCGGLRRRAAAAAGAPPERMQRGAPGVVRGGTLSRARSPAWARGARFAPFGTRLPCFLNPARITLFKHIDFEIPNRQQARAQGHQCKQPQGRVPPGQRVDPRRVY